MRGAQQCDGPRRLEDDTMRTGRGFSLKLGLRSAIVAGLTAASCGPPVGSGTGGTGGTAGSGGSAGSSGQLPCAVQQVLQARCQQCHAASPIFGAPMPLVSWADLNATRNGNKVYELVLNRIADDVHPMPPSPNPRLTQAEISTLQNWVSSGAPPGQACSGGTGGTGGNPNDEPAFPPDCQQRYQLRAHGLTGETDQTPYPVPTNGDLGNKYTCFYFRPPYADGSQALYLHSLFDRTNLKYLHHWILYGRDTPSHTAGTSSNCSAAEPGAYFITGWAPGSNPAPLPPDVGLNLPARTGELTLEIHYYNPSNDAGQQDATGVEFCTAPANTRPHTAQVSFTGSEGICIQPFATTNVVGQCTPRTDMGDIHIVGVAPHMHQAARRMSIVINRANGTKETLHDQPFDFNSQTFWPKDAVVHPGDTLTTTCYYQNTTANQIHFGERTQDEMCFGFITSWPLGALQNNPLDPGMFIGGGLQPARRCLGALDILNSCNGLADYPPGN